jgi:ElaA protein
MITWQCKFFSELTVEELYKILQLRSKIFVVEQQSAYQDCDGKDLLSFHFMGWNDEELVAYTRLIPKGISYPDAASIGRVVIAPSFRRKNIGRQLVAKSLEEIKILFGEVPLKISAQSYLIRFYESFSFKPIGNIYLEDGIEHIAMKK